MLTETLLDAGAETELIHDFMAESREAFEEIEGLWLRIETGRATQEDFGELIRRLHLIDSVLRIGGYDVVAGFGERIIAILDRVHTGRMAFSELLNDVVLFAIENLESFTEALFASQEIDQDVVSDKTEQLQRLLECGPEAVAAVAAQALEALTKRSLGVPVNFKPVGEAAPVAAVSSVDNYAFANAKRASDLAFFRDLAQKVERCHPNLLNRSAQILQISTAMNQFAGVMIDPEQLEAAVYMHDFGMAFLPSDPLRRGDALSLDERQMLREHPLVGSEMLHRVGGWDDAMRIVLQHHERVDGKGYPEGISGESICDGAKILAIADTIFAMTHKQSYRAFARPLFRAVAEINSLTGTQFAKEWVDAFNAVIRSSRGEILFAQQHD